METIRLDTDFSQSSIWYIRAGDETVPMGSGVSEASGISIRLRKVATNHCRNYLLTCAHVIRKASNRGFGPRHVSIRAWSPGSGYNPTGGILLEPSSHIFPVEPNIPGQFYVQPVNDVPNSDWALLAFVDAAIANDTNLSCSQNWHDAYPKRGTYCYAVGYPGGAKGFKGNGHAKNDIVRPSLAFGQQRVAAASNGVVEFQGTDCRPGMSGGGVYLADTNELVGLHRERQDSTLQLHAVSVVQIRNVLQAYGFEIVPPFNPGTSVSGPPDVDPSPLSPEELQSLATALLKTAASECFPGRRFEFHIGPGRTLGVIVSEFAEDFAQRNALEGELQLLEVQQSAMRHLRDQQATGLFPGAAFGIQIDRLQKESARTLQQIKGRLELMIARFDWSRE